MREFKIPNQTFGMDILCAEKEILFLFHNMCHVIVGAIAPVANVDILPAGESFVPVHDVAKCAKFVFFMHRLEDGIRIDVCIKVEKGIYMYAVDTAGRTVKTCKDGFKCFGLELCALLVQCGKGWHFLIQPPKVQHLHPGRRAFRDKK